MKKVECLLVSKLTISFLKLNRTDISGQSFSKIFSSCSKVVTKSWVRADWVGKGKSVI